MSQTSYDYDCSCGVRMYGLMSGLQEDVDKAMAKLEAVWKRDHPEGPDHRRADGPIPIVTGRIGKAL